MNRWTRWQFVVPRLLLCVIAALGLQYAAGLVARSIAVRLGADLVGGQVEVAHARVSLADGHVILGGMKVSDPRCPSESWFIADSCELEVAATPLLYRQTIVEKARLSGVRVVQSDNHRAVSATWFNDHAVEAARERLASIDKRFDQNYLRQLESVKRSTAFCTRFPDHIAALESRATELARLADELETMLDAASVNSLRHDKMLNDVPTRVAALRKELDDVTASFTNLPQQLDNERRAIVAARRQDEQFLNATLQFEAIDQNLLNAYLLREQVAQPLDEMATWLRSIRQIVSTDSTRQSEHKRGEDVLFAGMRPTPDFLIRAIEVQGETRFMGQLAEFRGLVSNLTTTPAIHSEPIQMRFSTAGSMLLEVRASINRTGGQVRDELFVDCREMPLVEQCLGRTDQLQLKLAPSVGAISVRMRIEGDKLSGDIQLTQKQVRMTPTLAGKLGELPIAAPLTDSLGQVNSLATRISLRGTIDKPECTLWSNLGSEVAEAMDRALQQHSTAHTHAVLAEARRHVDERLAGLERQLADHQAKFASTTADMPERIDTIARLQTRRERISVEQLGRRLPNTSLFR